MLLERREDGKTLPESLAMLVKEIQLLEDPSVLACLARGNVIEMNVEAFRVFFDVSRYGACLNVSFDEPRTFFRLEDYLAGMPVLSRAVGSRRGALHGIRLFLIHHITAEVMGLLRAFETAGCKTMTTFFVKYAGIVPEAYLETLMSLPPETFRFYGLQKMEDRRKLAGRYNLSRQLGPLPGLERLDEALFSGGGDFLEAMRLAAGHLLLEEIQLARRHGEEIVLVEDGGYMAPLINRFCLDGQTVGDVLSRFHVESSPEEGTLPFRDWLDGVFLGSVEHTKNGYDYNRAVENEFGRLQFPVASIAVSSLKRGPEARECAVSIINAAETILHRLGMLLSRRKIVVLGSKGAIGGYLKTMLEQRTERGHLFGVDIAASDDGREAAVPEARTLDGLGRDVLADVDMFIGVIGDSILQQGHMEDILLNSRRKDLLFVSGSTKTVEFSDLERYLQTLKDKENPEVRGHRVKVKTEALRDLQTGVFQGYEVSLDFPDHHEKNKKLYLLGELMPINFLYYGIPREIVDEIMAQLFTLSCGFVARQRGTDKLRPVLLAVDREIDADANPIPS
jgi:hypothetical protein